MKIMESNMETTIEGRGLSSKPNTWMFTGLVSCFE